MRTNKTITEERQVIDKITCDVCGRDLSPTDDNYVEHQEGFYYTWQGGYGSLFGDMCDFEIDICQHCFKEAFGEYVRLIAER
jgi:hypothetical protein